jgi:hypothetical protein
MEATMFGFVWCRFELKKTPKEWVIAVTFGV